MFVVLYSVWHTANIRCVVQLPELSTILGYTCFVSYHALHTVTRFLTHAHPEIFVGVGEATPEFIYTYIYTHIYFCFVSCGAAARRGPWPPHS